jgi:UDP-N-acetylmuramate dehydrogenase
LARVWRRAREAGLPVKVLGGGANVLIGDDGFDGLVVRLNDPAFRQIEFDDDGRPPSSGRVVAGGGVDLMRLSRDCAHRGLAGLECMGGIPGTVGGAVCMNAGGRWGQFGDVVRSVELLTPDGAVRMADRAELHFGYRHAELGGAIVLSVELMLQPDSPQGVSERFLDIWRIKKASQPLADKSAGCIFKNPSKGSPAGALIDAAGLKGTRNGGAYVSPRHANFIVADRHSKASHVIGLIDHVRAVVAKRFGVDLELEIDLWR